jgi:hypothetical protein
MDDAIDAAWAALCARLELRSRELHDDVCAYPTPIARCDVQLTQAIEARDAAFRRVRTAQALDGLRAAGRRDEWLDRVRAFAAEFDAADDDATAAARDRLTSELSRAPNAAEHR